MIASLGVVSDVGPCPVVLRSKGETSCDSIASWEVEIPQMGGKLRNICPGSLLQERAKLEKTPRGRL
jgi:hypothetical protein